jgi:hypothetical protein
MGMPALNEERNDGKTLVDAMVYKVPFRSPKNIGYFRRFSGMRCRPKA